MGRTHVAVIIGLLAGCGHGSDAGGDRPALGKERGDCKANKVCDPGLLCLSNLCVRPPPADCAAIGEQLASQDLGNYAELEQRTPLVQKYKTACDKAYVSKEQGECIEKAADRGAVMQCAPAMFPELKSSGTGDCGKVAAKIRGQMDKSMNTADPQTKQMFTKMMAVIQESCEQDKWPDGFKQCVMAAGDSTDAMNACSKVMPPDVQQKMTERLAKSMQAQ